MRVAIIRAISFLLADRSASFSIYAFRGSGLWLKRAGLAASPIPPFPLLSLLASLDRRSIEDFNSSPD